MPSTTIMLNWLAKQAGDWNRTGERGLLEALDETQKMLYHQESQQTLALNSSGSLPSITTTDETYSYTLNQATTGLSVDVWRCAGVLVKPPFSNQLLSTLRQEYGITPNLRQPVQTMEFNGIEYFRFYQVKTKDPVKDGHPTLTFTMNPGATTTDFYLLLHEKATTLTSEKIALTLPERLHIPVLLPAAMKYVEGLQNGNIIEALQAIDQVYKPMVQYELNQGDQGESHSITRFEE